ncbi:hypothetical protein DRN94_002645 [archaeon]|nr:hypothetical protein [archaeon]
MEAWAWIVAAIGIVVAVLFTAWVVVSVVRSFRQRPYHALQRLVGRRGYVRRRVAPGRPGVVVVDAEEWTAIADEEIEEGAAVLVVGVEGLRLRVKRSEQ